MARSLQPAQGKIYDNCRVVDTNNELMFHCSAKKSQWYLNRNLAEQVCDNPFTIKLLFTPNGPGYKGDNFGLTTKNNICVVCGQEAELTAHHIVPSIYRTHFPKEIKSHSDHDVVALCIDCHVKYEEFAGKLKNKLATEYKAFLAGYTEFVPGTEARAKIRAKSAANALLKYISQIPDARCQELLKIIKIYLNKEQITNEDIEQVYDITIPEYRWVCPHGLQVVSQVNDLQEFVVRWRQHFIDTMHPQYMPKHWDVNRDIHQRNWNNMGENNVE